MKVKSKFADGLNVRYKKKGGVKKDMMVFGVNKWKNKVAINYMGKNARAAHFR